MLWRALAISPVEGVLPGATAEVCHGVEVLPFGGGGTLPAGGKEAHVELLPPLGNSCFGVTAGELAVGGEVPDGLPEGLQEVGVAAAGIDQMGQCVRLVSGAEFLGGLSEGLGGVRGGEGADGV